MEDFKFAFGLNTFKGSTEIDKTYIQVYKINNDDVSFHTAFLKLNLKVAG